MKHFIRILAFIFPLMTISGCKVHTSQEALIIGGDPLYDVWPSRTFYYDNWPYFSKYNYGHLHHPHKHRYHYHYGFHQKHYHKPHKHYHKHHHKHHKGHHKGHYKK